MVFQHFQGFEFLNFTEKSMKNWCKFGLGKHDAKYGWKIEFRRVLGSIWEGFGPLWDVFWALLVALGRFCGPSKPTFLKALVQDGLQEAFWIHFGSILGGFGMVLGWICMGLGRIWALKIEAFASHGRIFSTLCAPCRLTVCYRNPRASSLRLAERHNARGFPNPSACWTTRSSLRVSNRLKNWFE